MQGFAKLAITSERMDEFFDYAMELAEDCAHKDPKGYEARLVVFHVPAEDAATAGEGEELWEFAKERMGIKPHVSVFFLVPCDEVEILRESPNGKCYNIPADMNDHHSKRRALRTAGRVLGLIGHTPVAMILSAEAWKVSRSKEEEIDRPVREMPDREEVLVFQAIGVDGYCKTGFIPVGRDDEENMVLGERHVEEGVTADTKFLFHVILGNIAGLAQRET